MTIDKPALKAMAEEWQSKRCAFGEPMGEMAIDPATILALLSDIDRLEGLRADPPPRPPEGDGLPRYGLRWNGPTSPVSVPREDGYWTPWHLADEMRKDAERNNRMLVSAAITIGEICEALGIDNHSEPDMIVEAVRELKTGKL